MIAQTIANQLGSLSLGLLGAHTLVDIGDGLQFHIRGSHQVNLIQIILDPCDTYTVRFCLVFPIYTRFDYNSFRCSLNPQFRVSHLRGS